jgi:hypothetical protein
LTIDEFPSLFPDFKQKCIQLVWRSSCDGLQASTFHNYYDDHANTLIIIEDTNRNIFGGYSSQTWESRECSKTDASHKNFLFILKNPHNILARIFPLQPEQNRNASSCKPNCCFTFGNQYSNSFNFHISHLFRYSDHPETDRINILPQRITDFKIAFITKGDGEAIHLEQNMFDWYSECIRVYWLYTR